MTYKNCSCSFSFYTSIYCLLLSLLEFHIRMPHYEYFKLLFIGRGKAARFILVFQLRGHDILNDMLNIFHACLQVSITSELNSGELKIVLNSLWQLQ